MHIRVRCRAGRDGINPFCCPMWCRCHRRIWNSPCHIFPACICAAPGHRRFCQMRRRLFAFVSRQILFLWSRMRRVVRGFCRPVSWRCCRGRQTLYHPEFHQTVMFCLLLYFLLLFLVCRWIFPGGWPFLWWWILFYLFFQMQVCFVRSHLIQCGRPLLACAIRMPMGGDCRCVKRPQHRNQ